MKAAGRLLLELFVMLLVVGAVWLFLVWLFTGIAFAQDHVVNVPSRADTACPCALKGAEGACFTKDHARAIRDAATIELPQCRKIVGAKDEECAAYRAATSACKAQAVTLDQALLSRREESEHLRKLVIDRPNRALWLGVGVGIGVLATVGVIYAIVPAVRSTATASQSISRPGLLLPPARPLFWWR